MGIPRLWPSPWSLLRWWFSSQSSELESYVGTQGNAVTDLRPAGIAVINGKRVDVVTRGEYLDKDSAIIVTAVTGNQIIVRKKDEP